MKVFLSLFSALALPVAMFAVDGIDGLDDSISRRVGDAELTLSKAGELSLSLKGEPVVLADHGSIFLKEAKWKFLYSSEWTKELPVIKIKDGVSTCEFQVSVEKEGVGSYERRIVLSDGKLVSHAVLKAAAGAENLSCGYSFALSPSLAGAYSISKDGLVSDGVLPASPEGMSWSVASGMSGIAFPKALGGKGLTIAFNSGKGAWTPWRFDDLRKHKAANIRGLHFESSAGPLKGGVSLEASFELKWGMPGMPADVAAAKNLFPGDSSFETGVGFWLPHCGWALDGGTAKDGRQSLRLEAPFLSSCYGGMLSSAPFALEPDSDYVLSAWMKGEEDGQAVNMRMIRGDWHCVGRDLKLSKEWKRFSITIPKTAPTKEPGLRYANFIVKDRRKVWIDAVKLEKGREASAYVQAEPVAASLVSGVPGNVFFDTDPVEFKLSVFNPSGVAQDLSASWTVTDGLSGKAVSTGSARLKLGASERRIETIQAFKGKAECGYYQLALSIEPGGIVDRKSNFVVAPVPQNLGRAFAGLRCEGTKEELEAAKRAGVRMVELAIRAGWDSIETSKGVYDENRLLAADDAVRLAHSLGFNIRVGIGHTPRWASTAPADNRDFGNYPPADYSDLTGFARFIARRYKNEVERWEVLGESDLSWRGNQGWAEDEAAKNIADFTKAVAIGVREGSPGARISACGMSSLDSMFFLEKVYGKCVEHVDDVDIHPYAGIRNLGPKGKWVTQEANGLSKGLADLERLVHKYNPKAGYGIGELGYTMDVTVAPTSEYAFEYAAIMQRAFLMAYLAKASKLSWYCSFNNDEPFGYRYGLWRVAEGYQPLPSVAAYSWMSHVLDGSEILSDKLVAQAIQTALLKRGDRAWFVLWNRRNDKSIELEFGNPVEGLRLYNMLGSPSGAWKAGDKVKCVIGKHPVYFECALADAEALEKAACAGEMHVPPLEMLLSMDRADAVKVELLNRVSQPVSGRIELSASQGWSFAGGSRDFGPVPVNGKVELTFPVSMAQGARQESLSVNVEAKTSKGKALSASRTFEIVWVPKAKAKPASGGAVPDWTDAPVCLSRDDIRPPDILNAGIWKGDKDFSVKFHRAWDETNLYMAFDVRDDIQYQKETGRQVYKGDCIQFATDTRNNCPSDGTYGEGSCELGFSLQKDGGEAYCWVAPKGQAPGVAKDVQVKAERRDGLTAYEVAIPWARLGMAKPSAGDVFKASFVVFDRDGSGEATRWMELSRGIAGGKNPSLFRTFALEGAN